ncbi:transposase [Phenylobacterium montanum]|nr:transposase [Caulobacter sp. S6]
MMLGDDVLMMPSARRIEVFTGSGRRRKWNSELKAQIVAESYATSVGDAAARHSLSKTQIFTWRRDAQRAAEAAGFARVEVDDAGAAAVMQRGLIEVRLRGASVSIEPGADPAMVTAILMALRAAR